MLSIERAGGGRSSPTYKGGSVGNGVGAAVVGAIVVVFFMWLNFGIWGAIAALVWGTL